MKISICQINPIIGDFNHNLSLIIDAAEKAKKSGCKLAVFPEMALMGYPPRDLLEKPAFIDANLKYLQKLNLSVEGIYIISGYVDKNPEKIGKNLINSVAILRDGHMLGRGVKMLLPSYDVFDETRYFEPAMESLVFEIKGKKIGVTICEDIWNIGDIEEAPRYHTDPVAALKKRGIDILINISASPFTLSKACRRISVLKAASLKYGIPILYCNQVGGNDDLLFDGSSMVVDRHGRLILMAKEFEPDNIIWDSEKDYDELTYSNVHEEELLLKGLVMGARDYLKKCGFKKAILGLSGGIDSSLVAVIAKLAMGRENVMGVSLPSPFTSEISRECARKLAENLGIDFREIPITGMFESYKAALSPSFKGLKEDVTEENIQARIRGNILMALSNKFNALLLTTGNKSETATGYCTLYGDMCGGLAVISDVPKTLCYRLARHINREQEIIPSDVINRPPSAELRHNQRDQDTLPPYDILDGIVEAAVEKNLSQDEIIAMGYDSNIVRDVMKRIVFNEHKRRQAAPGLKITSKAFGYGRRYPIARGREIY
ncbi:MAG: NAD+ synthase [Deltaproteobacteria bacterium]|nr:NAD+ synthase [Deltaproteobacteria bacterium]